MQSNRLLLNIEKTYSILFTNRPNEIIHNMTVQINEKIIPFENHLKFLGIILDKKLTYEHHINHIIGKLSKTIGIFYKLRYNAPKHVLVSLYYSLIYPYLIYGNLIWGNTYQTYINKIFLLQKKVIRIIALENFRAHTNPIFLECKILKIQDICKYNLAIYAFKQNLNSNLETRTHNYGTRGQNSAVPAFRRLASTQRSLSYSAPTVWNSLPSEV